MSNREWTPGDEPKTEGDYWVTHSSGIVGDALFSDGGWPDGHPLIIAHKPMDVPKPYKPPVGDVTLEDEKNVNRSLGWMLSKEATEKILRYYRKKDCEQIKEALVGINDATVSLNYARILLKMLENVEATCKKHCSESEVKK